MRSFFKSIKFKIVISILAALLLGVFVAAVSVGGTGPVTSGLNYVLSPLNSAAARLKERLGDIGAGFRSSSYYLEEINSLKLELETYRETLVDYEKLQHKLAAYEEFLQIKSDHPDFSFTPATVILRDPAELLSSFTVNKGSSDGLEPGMPVIAGKNLVGVIREVSPRSAVVYTLYHPDVSVSAYEIRTREDCYTESSFEYTKQGLVKLMGLSRATPVVSGGIVCTSGIGGVCPRDLIVGTVSQVMNSEADISAYALVKPAADLKNLTDVFVITDFEDKPS